MERTANAVWRGSGRSGSGTMTTESGVLADTPYSFRTRFEGEKGTNPEELIAAAHAACFTMSVAFRLQSAGHTAEELRTDAVITLEQQNGGFTITRSALTLRARVAGVEPAEFERLAREAETSCPVSKVLRATITLDARLE